MSLIDDALSSVSSRFDGLSNPQSRQIRDRASGVYSGVSGKNRVAAERVPVPVDDIQKYWNMYRTVPLVRAPFNQFRDDIIADGYRIEADSKRTRTFLEGWSETGAVVEAERNRDIYRLLHALPTQALARGTVFLEHAPDGEDGDKTAGLSFINPTTLTPYRASDTNLLLRPGDTQYEGAKLTDDGEAAAFVQFDAGPGKTSDDERRLTLDDVTRIPIDAGVNDVFGTSRVAPVAPRIEAVREKLQDNDRAVKTNAFKNWFVAFGHETVTNEDGSETIIEWSDDDMDEFMDDLQSVEPGDIEGHDGTIEINGMGGDTADIINQLKYETHYILTAMPAPTYAVGFESDINQFVVDGQEERHEQRIEQFRKLIERELTPIYRQVAEQNDLKTSGIQFKLEPPAESSPILSMSDAEVERLSKYATALKTLSGGKPRTLVPDDVLREDLLRIEDVGDGDGEYSGWQPDPLEDLKDLQDESGQFEQLIETNGSQTSESSE